MDAAENESWFAVKNIFYEKKKFTSKMESKSKVQSIRGTHVWLRDCDIELCVVY